MERTRRVLEAAAKSLHAVGVWALAAPLLALVDPVEAVTPLRTVYYASDITVELDGEMVSPSYMTHERFADGHVYFFDEDPPWLDDGKRVTAFALRFNSDRLFATDMTIEFPLFAAAPGDLLRWDGTEAVTKRFSPQAAGIPAGVLVDAVSEYGNDLLLSFDTTVSLVAYGGGTLAAGKEDLVRMVSGTTQFLPFFDGSAVGVPAGMNLDGAQYMYTNGHHVFLSFDGSGTLGGVDFDKDDIIEYDGATEDYSLAYNGNATHAGWPPANLVAFALEAAAPSVGGGRLVGQPGGSACLSPVLDSDGTQISQMSATLQLPFGQINFIYDCAIPPMLPGAGYSTSYFGSSVSAGTTSPAVLLPDGTSVSCRVRLGSSLSLGTQFLSTSGQAANPSFESYDIVGGTRGTLVVTRCGGDCDGNGQVSIGDVQRAVNVHLGAPMCNAATPSASCPTSDANADGRIALGELQAGVNDFLAGCPTSSAAKRIFFTSTSHNGNFGGLAGADSICAARATAAGLPGTFKAWLSTDSVSAASRLNHWNGPYALVDGTLIADGWTDLTDGTLQNPINRNELGETGNQSYWVGTTASGASHVGNNCAGWTLATGGWGSDTANDLEPSGGATCSLSRRVLCIQQ